MFMECEDFCGLLYKSECQYDYVFLFLVMYEYVIYQSKNYDSWLLPTSFLECIHHISKSNKKMLSTCVKFKKYYVYHSKHVAYMLMVWGFFVDCCWGVCVNMTLYF